MGKESSGARVRLKVQMPGCSPEAFPPVGTARKIEVQLPWRFLVQAPPQAVIPPIHSLIKGASVYGTHILQWAWGCRDGHNTVRAVEGLTAWGGKHTASHRPLVACQRKGPNVARGGVQGRLPGGGVQELTHEG